MNHDTKTKVKHSTNMLCAGQVYLQFIRYSICRLCSGCAAVTADTERPHLEIARRRSNRLSLLPVDRRQPSCCKRKDRTPQPPDPSPLLWLSATFPPIVEPSAIRTRPSTRPGAAMTSTPPMHHPAVSSSPASTNEAQHGHRRRRTSLANDDEPSSPPSPAAILSRSASDGASKLLTRRSPHPPSPTDHKRQHPADLVSSSTPDPHGPTPLNGSRPPSIAEAPDQSPPRHQRQPRPSPITPPPKSPSGLAPVQEPTAASPPPPPPPASRPSNSSGSTSGSRKQLGEWTLGKTLGAGSMGKVKLGVNRAGDKASTLSHVLCQLLSSWLLPREPDGSAPKGGLSDTVLLGVTTVLST
jgi:hypothetical protein